MNEKGDSTIDIGEIQYFIKILDPLYCNEIEKNPWNVSFQRKNTVYEDVLKNKYNW